MHIYNIGIHNQRKSAYVSMYTSNKLILKDGFVEWAISECE